MNPLVKRSLQINGAATFVFGIVLLVFASPLAAEFALPKVLPVEIAGAICAAFGPLLLWAARRELPARRIRLLAALDTGWIAASLLAAAIVPMSALGRSIVVAQALLVTVLVAMELAGLRQELRSSARPAA